MQDLFLCLRFIPDGYRSLIVIKIVDSLYRTSLCLALIASPIILLAN
jgi:hypothetical protein